MWTLAALLFACEAHVQLKHKQCFTLPIRNAPNPPTSADGQLSVAGPCGGVNTWGANGYSNVTVGQNLSLVYAYNGGHQSPTLNILRAAMVCGRQDNADPALAANGAVIPQQLQPNINASLSLTTGYTLWAIVPPINSGTTNGQYCTISVMDQRNWGGCVDLMVTASAAPPTPAPANVLTGISLAGTYSFGAANCHGDSTNCCCISGSATVTHVAGATTGTASITYTVGNTANGTACNKTISTTPITGVLLTQLSPTLGAISGTVICATGFTLDVQVVAGPPMAVIITDASAVPAVCGVNAPQGGSTTPTGSGFMAAFSPLLLLALLCVH